LVYVTPKNEIKSKTKINGINQKNCIFENSITGKDETKITHAVFKDMYFKTVNYNDTVEEDIKFMYMYPKTIFILPDRLKKINYYRTRKEMEYNIPWFSVHCNKIERTLFKTEWEGRQIFKFPYTVPNHSYYYENENQCRKWLNEFSNYR